tara:strand:+ start:220 stop:591 length:372 start_codon:yes stop_codon:yes gene_type:complete
MSYSNPHSSSSINTYDPYIINNIEQSHNSADSDYCSSTANTNISYRQSYERNSYKNERSMNPEISDLERGLRIISMDKYLEILQNENITVDDFKEGLDFTSLKNVLNIPLGDAFKIVNYFSKN